jgi:hypothetical protein
MGAASGSFLSLPSFTVDPQAAARVVATSQAGGTPQAPAGSFLKINPKTGKVTGVITPPTSRGPTADFSPARVQEAYSIDAGWAGAAELLDPRIAGRCGGGGCNAPSCAYQSWRINLPCNEQNLQAYMFQLPRFLWASNRLTQLYGSPPEPFDGLTNRAIAARAWEWAIWLDEVYRAMGLLRWSANVRWELVTSKIKLPFEWGLQPYIDPDAAPHPFWGVASSADLRGDALLSRLYAEPLLRSRTTAAPTMLMESPLTWAYMQAGANYHPDCRPWVNSGNMDHGGEPRQLAWPLKVPQSVADFSPRYGIWQNYATPTMPAAPVASAGGRRITYEYQCGWGSPSWGLYMGYMNEQPYQPAGGVGRFLEMGGRSDLRPDQLCMMLADFGAVVATPLMQVLVAKERCAAYMALQFGDVISAGLSAWSDMILAMPEEMRGVSAQDLEAVSQGLGQAQLNAAASYVYAGFGAAASLVTAVVPQPYGAIIGAVIAVIGLIAAEITRAAYDLGLARPDRPPCPPPPLLRNIAEAECDFDTATQGVARVLGRSTVVAELAARGQTDPGAWLDAIKALEAEPQSEEAYILPPPDRAPEPEPFPWLPILGGTGAALLLVAALRGRS